MTLKSPLSAWVVMTLLLLAVPTGNLYSQQEEDQRRDYKPKVGQLHPKFVMPNIENDKPVRLSDFAGKKVLLINFASW